LKAAWQGGKLRVETIRAANRDPLFGGFNHERSIVNLRLYKARVREKKALVGVATDGDRRRVWRGNELGGDDDCTMWAALLLHLFEKRKMTGGCGGAEFRSRAIEANRTAHNLKLYQTAMGFKYIAD